MNDSRIRKCLLIALMLFVSVTITDSQIAAQQPINNPPADAKQNCPESEQLRKNIQQLNSEIQRLKRKVTDYEKDRLASTIQEQLTKEEQRGEGLQLRLIEIAEKEVPLQARFDELNIQLRPENLERALAGVGSVHPENTREDLRRKLLGDRQRVMYQLELLRQDRVRTQASLATTDAAIQRLKQKLAEALRPY